MGVSEYMNQHPKIAVACVAGLVAASVAFAAYRMSDDGSGPPTKAFYTDDDGKTTFVDSVDQYPPFEHDGKTAVRAEVFTADGGKTQFVGYLERYTPDAIKKLQAADADRKAGKNDKLTADSQEILLGGTEVKKPGETNWVPPSDRAGRNRVVTVAKPNSGPVDSVFP